MKEVKVGIIGLGAWGESHLEAYSSLPHVRVVAVCDNREERLEAAAGKYRVSNCYTDYRDLLGHGEIELVSVVTYEKEHLEPVLAALNAGKHVLVEKPVSTLPEEAKRMRQAALDNGRFLLPGHLLRFDPRYVGIHEAIRNDKIGKPVSLYMKRSREKKLFPLYQRTHTVFELTIHDLDLAIWYAGSRVTTVKAYGQRMAAAGSPEVLWVCLEFANGAVAFLHSNWMTPNEAKIVIADAIEVVGERGTAHFETSNSGLQVWNEEGRSSPDTNLHYRMLGQSVGALREQLLYICRCLADGRSPDYISFDDAVHGVEVADAVVKSCETGLEVRL